VPKAALDQPAPAAVERGLPNLAKHLESIRDFGEVPVVALNRFAADTAEEIDVVRRAATGWGAPFAVCEAFGKGGEGAVELAAAVVTHAETKSSPFRPLYSRGDPAKEKMAKIARHMYGADAVEWTREAERDLGEAERLGYGDLPLCVAKTQMSLSDDPRLVGRPEGFDVTVRGVLLAAGAGYLVPLLGDILRMPGLPASPQAERIDLVEGRITGMV
jgi:formate--tetrahydrofolate ligase